MNLRLGISLLLIWFIADVKCWVEMDIAGEDLSKPNPKFVNPEEEEECEDDDPKSGEGVLDMTRTAKPTEGSTTPDDDACDFPTSPKTVTEIPQEEQIKMLEHNQIEDEKEKVEETPLDTTECTEYSDIEPVTRTTIEYITVPYTELHYRTVTRKIVYIQRRKKLKKTVNKPILVIRRKVVKDRQLFERIIPRIIETREVINKPKTDFSIIEGPLEQVLDLTRTTPVPECEPPCPTRTTPYSSFNDPFLSSGGQTPPPALPGTPPPPEFGAAPPPPAGQDGIPSPGGVPLPGEIPPPGGMPPPGGVPPPGEIPPSAGIPPPDAQGGGLPPPSSSVHTDFSNALGDGLNAAFKDEVVPPASPKMRSLMYGNYRSQTTCAPGHVSLGQGASATYQHVGQAGGQNVVGVAHVNPYGQSVLSFYDKNKK